MKIRSISKIALTSLFILPFSVSYIAATECESVFPTTAPSKLSSGSPLKTMVDFHYSPLLDKEDPKKLISDWISLNEFLQLQVNSGDNKSLEQLTLLRERHLRLLSNIGSHTRSTRTTPEQAFHIEFVAFSEVCYFSSEEPAQIAQQYSISDEVFKFYMNEYNAAVDNGSILQKRAR